MFFKGFTDTQGSKTAIKTRTDPLSFESKRSICLFGVFAEGFQ
jgi:hypothetical protein